MRNTPRDQIRFSKCSPADGTNAAFEIAGLRQAPLAALDSGYISRPPYKKGARLSLQADRRRGLLNLRLQRESPEVAPSVTARAHTACSGAEGRPDVPSTWRSHPPLTKAVIDTEPGEAFAPELVVGGRSSANGCLSRDGAASVVAAALCIRTRRVRRELCIGTSLVWQSHPRPHPIALWLAYNGSSWSSPAPRSGCHSSSASASRDRGDHFVSRGIVHRVHLGGPSHSRPR